MQSILLYQNEVRCSSCLVKLDRLDWTAGFAFDCFGVRIGIRTNVAHALESVEEALPPGWQRDPAPNVDTLYSLVVGGTGKDSSSRRYHILYAGATPIARTFDWQELLVHFRIHLQSTVAKSTREGLFVNGGAVGWRNQAILLIGKDVEVPIATLVRQGATYISSPYIVFGPDGCVYPFPTALYPQPGDKSDPTMKKEIAS